MRYGSASDSTEIPDFASEEDIQIMDACIGDIRSSILNLRDASDYALVSDLFKQKWPMLDPVFVQAPVCRPGWLIEMECVAIFEKNTDGLPIL